jgi:inner membrane protein
MEHPDLKVLRWFSKEYYSLQKIDATKQIIYKDLRYPLMIEDDANSSLFSFELVQENERWNTKRFQRDLQIESIWDFFGGIYGRAFRDF